MPGDVGKGEPKAYYANERNYIHWLHMGVTLGSVALMVGRIGKDEYVASDHRAVTLAVSSILALIAIWSALFPSCVWHGPPQTAPGCSRAVRCTSVNPMCSN